VVKHLGGGPLARVSISHLWQLAPATMNILVAAV
jgi:hypothetical protein